MTRKLLTKEEAEYELGTKVPAWLKVESLAGPDSHSLDGRTYNITVSGCLPSQVKKLIKFTMSAKF